MTIKHTALFLLSIFGTALQAMEKNHNAQLAALQTTQKKYTGQLAEKRFYSARAHYHQSPQPDEHEHTYTSSDVASYQELGDAKSTTKTILPAKNILPSPAHIQHSLNEQKHNKGGRKPFLPNRPDLSGLANKGKRRAANQQARNELMRQENLKKIQEAAAKAAVAHRPLTNNNERACLSIPYFFALPVDRDWQSTPQLDDNYDYNTAAQIEQTAIALCDSFSE